MNDHKKRFPLGRIVSLIFLLVILACILIGTNVRYHHDLILLDHGQRVTATVTNETRFAQSSVRHFSGYHWITESSYVVDGTSYEYSEKSLTDNPDHAVGEQIELLYDPEDPSYARPTDTINADKIGYWRILSYAALGAAVILYLIGVHRFRSRKRRVTGH